MTPKEKAEEMYRTDIDYTHGHFNCKQCVRIAVDEIIEQCEFDVINDIENERYIDKLNYWDEVKLEIEKL
jgi:hypothetical protein